MRNFPTKECLIKFEEDIADCFNNKLIRAPVHLYNGNENEIIKIFSENNISEDDWVFCTWRSHFQCLLKGVPSEILKADILAGKSITLCYPEYNIFSSAIVAGNIPIAVGTALALKRDKKKGKVYVFLGDMASTTGLAWESFNYSVGHELPIKFIVEDNGKSVCTNTRKTWGDADGKEILFESLYSNPHIRPYLYYYKYESKWPHAGAGSRIQF